MTESKNILQLAPRILGILFLVFLMTFSFDVFEPGLSMWQVSLAFLIHNIPVFILLLGLIASWKHEIVGGVTFILAGVTYILLLAMNSEFEWYMVSWALLIAGPAFVIGGLFIANWHKRRNHTHNLSK